MVNGGINPILHFGSNSITFNGGLQFTVRRDKISPRFMNQNLFRQFLYISTNSFSTGFRSPEAHSVNWAFHGPESSLARPVREYRIYGRTAMGQYFADRGIHRPRPSVPAICRRIFQHVFLRRPATQIRKSPDGGRTRRGSALLASTRHRYAIAQALLPGGRFDLRATSAWEVQGSFVLSRGMRVPLLRQRPERSFSSLTCDVAGQRQDDDLGQVPVSYPMRFSFGRQQQTFYNFPGSTSINKTLLPIVHFTLF